MAVNRELKPLVWVGRTLEDLRAFPADVQDVMGYALYLAQTGGKHAAAKPLKGFGGAGVLEIIEDYAGDTYRAVYTVKMAGIVYALHAFQKKARKGVATPQEHIDLIKARLRLAVEHCAEWTAARRKERRP